MKSFVITSLRKDAGKTGIIAGLGLALDAPVAYLKPFGDRLRYHEKKSWDIDALVLKQLFHLSQEARELSVGFDHSKIRYLYPDQVSCERELLNRVKAVAGSRDILFVESGNNINFGMSVGLDAISIAKTLQAKLIVVTHGNGDKIVDDLTFLKQHVDLAGAELGGVILNKIRNIDKFSDSDGILDGLDLIILGIIPFEKELSRPSVRFIADLLQAKVLSGEESLSRIIHEIFVGAMSADAVLRMSRFKQKDKIIITSGDRSDMILAAIDTECLGVVLTNNILPPPNIVARAASKNIPLLLAEGDTYQIAKKIDQSVPLLDSADTHKQELWKKLVRENVDLKIFAR